MEVVKQDHRVLIKSRRYSSLLLALMILSLPISAQEGSTGNWLMYFGMNRISERVSLHSEIQAFLQNYYKGNMPAIYGVPIIRTDFKLLDKLKR